MVNVTLDSVTFRFEGKRNSTNVINNLSLFASCGEIIGIMGSSGSGKSTLLRLIAGLLKPESGKIIFSAAAPKIGFLFQDDVLLPWRTVGRNLEYPLEGLKLSAEQRRMKAEAICNSVRLSKALFWERYPNELSGGERRRLSIGMAIAREVDLLLMDEPTAQLDEKNQWVFQDLIQELWLTGQPTVIVVTHNLEEAIVLADRLLILDRGDLVATFDIRLPRPRPPAIRDETQFLAIRKAVSQKLSRIWKIESWQ